MEQLKKDKNYSSYLLRLIKKKSKNANNIEELQQYITKVNKTINKDEIVQYVDENNLKFDYKEYCNGIEEILKNYDKTKELENNTILNNNNKNDNQKEKQKTKKKKHKKIFSICISIIFISILSYIAFYSAEKIILWKRDSNNTNKLIEEINKQVVITETPDTENTEIIEEINNNENNTNNDYWYYITFPLINVDFENLKSINNDTVAWINVNNTNINYPVVQATDNEFYLNHSFNKEYNEAGWVFLDCRNNKDFSDKNTVIYAHSRLDKTMFGSLSKTLKSSWYQNKDNHIIRISNEHENSLWQIFSIYVIETENYYITTNFKNDEDFNYFLNIMLGRSIYNFNTTLNTNDRILTLSTCYDDNRKTVVHAKLLKKESR